MVVNYVCRKCGKRLYEVDDSNNWVYSRSYGKLLRKNHGHNCPQGIQDDELIFCDMVSISMTPLPDSEKIYRNEVSTNTDE